MKIEYAGGSNLYVPATQLDVIQKYADGDAKPPKLNKLGTQEWSRTKSRVKSAVRVIAQDLVKLYAQRQRKEGFVYSDDTVWQREFEEMFPFEDGRPAYGDRGSKTGYAESEDHGPPHLRRRRIRKDRDCDPGGV